MVRNCVAAGLRHMVLLGVRTEQTAPFIASEQPGYRMDITIDGGQGFVPLPPINGRAVSAAKGVLLDVKLTDPTCQTHIARASNERGYAAEACAREKHRHYQPHFPADTYVLIAFVVETYGTACSEVHKFIDALASYRAEHSAGTWRKSSAVDWWRRRLSVAVQSAVSSTVDTSMRRSHSGEAYTSYIHTSLLATPATTTTAYTEQAQQSAHSAQ